MTKHGSRALARIPTRQREAISGLARELTRQLMLMAVGLRAGADAMSARLPGGYEAITWGQIGGFKYREGGPLPAHVMALSGRRVGLPGFMLTLGETGSAREFVLVESLWGCCFGSSPEINQVLVVRMEVAQTADYTALPVVVLGTLEVGEEREGQFVTTCTACEMQRCRQPMTRLPSERCRSARIV